MIHEQDKEVGTVSTDAQALNKGGQRRVYILSAFIALLLLLLLGVGKLGGFTHAVQWLYQRSALEPQIRQWQRELYELPTPIEVTHIGTTQAEVVPSVVAVPPSPARVRRAVAATPQESRKAAAPPTNDHEQMIGAIVALEGIVQALQGRVDENREAEVDICHGIDLTIFKYSTCILPFDEGGYARGAGGAGGSIAPAAPVVGGGGAVIIIGGGGGAAPPPPIP